MATMNILERRHPQDGRLKLEVDGRIIDLRVSTLPSLWGENLVMRIIDQESISLDLNKIGLDEKQLEALNKEIHKPYGMVLVTGPTACGKTTTLYAALNAITTPTKNILTVEDPVEYRLPDIIQIQVNPKANLTFPNVLRAFLRQDPNVMLVGEIRDNETADIAVKAALTGHLVLSTLHTNDAPSTIARLMDMGIDNVYVGSAVLMCISQRLLRRNCEKCKKPIDVSPEELVSLNLTPKDIEGHTIYKGAGCPVCFGTGYKGRFAVFEVMPITHELRELIFAKANLNEIKAKTRALGIQSLRVSALNAWKQGLTTIEEVLHETVAEQIT